MHQSWLKSPDLSNEHKPRRWCIEQRGRCHTERSALPNHLEQHRTLLTFEVYDAFGPHEERRQATNCKLKLR